MEDRRKLKRKYLAFFTRIFDRQTGRLIGHLADATVEGVMIISETPLRTEVDFQLSMDLPEMIFGKDALEFEAKSVWCKPDINPAFYNTGFQLLNLSKEKVNILEQIIEVYGIRE